ncbi:hypothetical protein AVEN_113155-1 [Araneus ventricosus]|uniref:Uncharacterized protein n=1 Tax=Araneus ventricosus TaxID=182803 RepID=A0A4Y2NHL9_ARAVE|nr:hypothetical protein AVEN_113155-1 [Araneus ventricosus]
MSERVTINSNQSRKSSFVATVRSFNNAIVIATVYRYTRGRDGLAVRFRPRDWRVRKPIPLKIRHVWDLLHAKSCVVAKRPPVGMERKLREGGASSGVVLVF